MDNVWGKSVLNRLDDLEEIGAVADLAEYMHVMQTIRDEVDRRIANAQKTKREYTARYNSKLTEWEVFLNGEIFCHLSEYDFDVFKADLKYEVFIL